MLLVAVNLLNFLVVFLLFFLIFVINRKCRFSNFSQIGLYMEFTFVLLVLFISECLLFYY